MARDDRAYYVAAWLFVLAVVALTLYRQSPPAPVGADAPATEFSSARAMKHVAEIGKEPHPMGTAAHDVVRDYIVAELTRLGLRPEVQEAATDDYEPGSTIDADIQNIAARLPGAQPGGKAVALVAHYDSAQTSSGACDDGAGVAALLETARALKAGPQLKRDVIFLFTDGEEEVLLGGKAFMAEHEWAKDVGLALNFEARGCKGAAFMFETSDGNGQLVREFGKLSPYPLANSLMFDIYQLMNLTTDLKVFKRENIPGLNFAFVEDATRHHAPGDVPSALGEGSVQHLGINALALTRHYADTDLNIPRAANAVYFDVLGAGVVAYPRPWAMPLAAAAAALFLCALVFGLVRRRLKILGVLLGVAALGVSLFVSCFVATFVWQAERGLHADYTRFSNYKIYLAALCALALAVTWALFLLARRKAAAVDLYFGALLLWAIAEVLVGLYRPYASYVTLWPFLFGVLGAVFLLARGEREAGAPAWVVLCLCAVPGIVLLTDTVYIVALGVGMGSPMILAGGAALLFGLLVPQMTLGEWRRRWALPALSLIAALVLLAAGNLTHPG